MRKEFLLFCCFFLTGITIKAQTLRPVQWASSVIAFSSEFAASPANFSAVKLLGAPEYYPQCGSNGNCWAPATKNGSREYFVVGFSTPQPVSNIRIYQSWGPGAVDTVYIRNSSTGIWTEVYQTTVVTGLDCPGTALQLLEINIPVTAYNVDAVRVAIASQTHLEWNEFDAISIANFDELTDNYNQYATSVIQFSSEFNPSPGSFSTDKLKGIPDAGSSASSCGSYNNAWASSTANGQREYFVLGYSYPAKVNRVMIHQTLAPGGVDTVYLREYGTNTWHQVFQATAAAAAFCIPGKYLEINFTKTPYLVDAVRVAINSPAVTDFQEIDAVGIRCELPGNAKRSVANGNWSNTSTWEGGVLPTSSDTVLIGPHSVTLNANGSAAAVVISNLGTLNINSASTLTVGPFGSGGGNKVLDIQGAFGMSNGMLNIGGRIAASGGSSFNMSGGTIFIDGNDGTLSGSVADDKWLADFPSGMNAFSFTGGVLGFVDPSFGTSGNTLRSNYNFGTGSSIRFGNGTSITAGGNSNGFFLTSASPSQIGSLIVDASSGINRKVTVARTTIANGSLTITSGELQTNSSFTAAGSITNSGSFTINSNVRTNGSFTNNGTTSMIAGSFSIGDDLINNNGAVYTVSGTRYTSVNDDVTNDGSFTSNWLFFADDFNTASLNAQTIGGSGIFNIYGLEVVNSNAAGTSLQVNLNVQEIFFVQGKLFLGNNTLTFNSTSAGYGSPGSGNYVVTDGTGRLRYNSVGVPAILFPIGTSTTYNPVSIANGNGHSFSCGVQPTFTNPLPGNDAVLREWDINDLTGGGVSATLTFQWNQAEEGPGFTRTLCYVAHYGTHWEPVYGSKGPASGPDPYIKTVNNVSTFSPFAVTSNAAVLPLTLVNFLATKEGNTTKINWQTTSEINISYFEIERSIDGTGYSSILKVAATNTSGPHNYTSVDLLPSPRINYYRLKIVENDGRSTHSIIVKIDFSKKYSINILPNPAKEYIVITGSLPFTQVQIFDMSGKLVKLMNKEVSNRYNILGLAKGIYMVRLAGAEETITSRLIIE